MLLRLVAIISFLFIGNFSQAQSLCSDVFTVDFFEGRLMSSNATHDVYFVGSGEAGGSVYRIVNRETGRSHLRKHYKRVPSLLNDVHALRLLAELSGNDPLVQINQPLDRVGTRRLTFPDVRGYTLYAHPNSLRGHSLMREYQYWALRMKDTAEARGFEINALSRSHIWMKFNVPDARRAEFDGLESINFFLKPDNVIVDSYTGKMVIFDPF